MWAVTELLNMRAHLGWRGVLLLLKRPGGIIRGHPFTATLRA